MESGWRVDVREVGENGESKNEGDSGGDGRAKGKER